MHPNLGPLEGSSRNPMRREVHNIILFGESGSGKSSLVNLIVGESVAQVSSRAEGCTFQNQSYETTIKGTRFRIYDTVGLNEGDQGRVPHWKAIQGLYTLIRELESVSLLVYCTQWRVKENSRANWLLFNKVVCGEKVPIIAAVTGLEDEDNPDEWWGREENRSTFRNYGMIPEGVACVVSILGRTNEYQEKYDRSRRRLHRLIEKYHRNPPWREEKEQWFANIYRNVYTTKICFLRKSRLQLVGAMQGVVDEFIREARMDEEDAGQLHKALLQAEKRIKTKKKTKRKGST